MKVLITAIEKGAVFDGPGIRTVVYFKGCPLRCLWCSNPETQKLENEYYIGGEKNPIDNSYLKVAKEMTVNEIFKEVMKDEKFYRISNGGVTLSGGEILLNSGFGIKLFELLKEEYINTAIETTGYGKYVDLESLAKLTGTILFDLKHMNSEIHKKYTGVSNDIILENLEKLSKWHKNIIIRYPFIKEVNDDEENITNTAQFIKKLGLKEIDILPYHTMGMEKYRKLKRKYPMKTLEKNTEKELSRAIKIIKSYNLNVKLNG